MFQSVGETRREREEATMRNHDEANLMALIDSTEDMWGSVIN